MEAGVLTRKSFISLPSVTAVVTYSYVRHTFALSNEIVQFLFDILAGYMDG